ncbi:MAG: AI-2E family transporter [Candidatus Sericytochromatia bacterium]|nr:AI-2E family transporter [Candidatus Tanganyikabacteria bacterium]
MRPGNVVRVTVKWRAGRYGTQPASGRGILTAMERPTFRIAPVSLAAITALVLGIWLLLRLVDVLVLVFLAALVAAALQPAVTGIRRRTGLGQGPAAVLAFAGSLLLFLAAGAALVPSILGQAEAFASALPGLAETWREHFGELRRLAVRVGMPLGETDLAGWVAGRAAGAIRSGVSVAGTVLGAVANTGIVLVTALFILIDAPLLERGVLACFPPARRPQVRAQLEPIALRLGAYVRAMLLTLAALAALLAAGYSLIGLPFGVVLAVVTGLLELVPFGGAVGGLLALLVAISGSPAMALKTLLVFVVAQGIQQNLIGPWLYARAVDLPPSLLILGILLGGSLLGLQGALIAVPLTAVLLEIGRNLWVPLVEGRPLPVLEAENATRAEHAESLRQQGQEGHLPPDRMREEAADVPRGHNDHQASHPEGQDARDPAG